MQIILHLGGNSKRAIKAAELAASMPDAIVVVSSEDPTFYGYYDEAGISRQRIIVNNEAWDTVTNFTHTYKLLKSLRCSKLYVVTDLFHIYRAHLIALACWIGRCQVKMVPYGTEERPDDRKYAWNDFTRALIWRLFGILFYDKKIKAQRRPEIKPGEKHSWLEIGI